ncbi:MAG: D-amino acid aminotransferase [Gammaproteobacteria bacterium]|nr:MAG: D-amino acid aminotransferase [Gammaproteobacteria bacterium]
MSEKNPPLVWLNGHTMPLSEARISVLDRGFLFGDGVYEVISVYDGKPFLLDEHLRRLERSMDAVRLGHPHDRDTWKQIIDQVVKANGNGEQSVYVQVTRGTAPLRDHKFPANPKPTVLVMASPGGPVSQDLVNDGIRAVILDDIRWEQCNVKSTMLLANVLLRQQALDAGAHEAILVRDGHLTEGAASNVFVVIGGVVVTPPNSDELLPGITRSFILGLCRDHGVSCAERGVSEDELRGAEEIWISSSRKEVLAVVNLDGNSVGTGKPGPVFTKVFQWFQEAKRAA